MRYGYVFFQRLLYEWSLRQHRATQANTPPTKLNKETTTFFKRSEYVDYSYKDCRQCRKHLSEGHLGQCLKMSRTSNKSHPRMMSATQLLWPGNATQIHT